MKAGTLCAYDFLELCPNLLRGALESWIVDCLHRCDRIDRGNLDSTTVSGAHVDIAWQHRAELVLELEPLVRSESRSSIFVFSGWLHPLLIAVKLAEYRSP